MIDVKGLTIGERFVSRSKAFIRRMEIKKMVKQAKSWATRYPGREPVYVFDGVTTEGIPPDLRTALEAAGVTVRGSESDLTFLATPP